MRTIFEYYPPIFIKNFFSPLTYSVRVPYPSRAIPTTLPAKEIVMSWKFDRAAGQLISPAGDVYGAYSGQPPYVGSVADDWRVGLGPLPAGRYTFGDVRADGGHMGPFVLPLLPDPANDMKGREAFFLHGDSIAHPGYASEGCIVAARQVREEVADGSDKELEVV